MGQLDIIGRIKRFFVETAAEFGRCTWPSRSELVESTLLVISVTVALAVFVMVADQLSRLFIRLITGGLF